MSTTSTHLNTYLDAFTAFEKRASGTDSPWLRKLRADAFARFCETGFPTTHDEDWRFTNVSAVARTPFTPAVQRQLAEGELEGSHFEGAGARLIFVNGFFARELSSVPKEVSASSLREQLAANPDAVEKHLGKYLDIRRDAFCALNTAFGEDGAFIHVGRGTAVEKPIHLLFVSTTNDRPTMTHPRNLLVFEAESEATVIEEYISLGSGPVLCNSATELIAGENSTISHYMI